MSYCPLFKIRFPDFSWLCFHISEWKLIASFGMKSYRSTSTFVGGDYRFALCLSVCLSFCHSVILSVILSVCHTSFPEISGLCFHISGWNLVASFHMKSYTSSSVFVTVDSLFQELLPFDQNLFSKLFLAMLSHIWMKVGSKLPYEELQFKFDFFYDWPAFSWVIALCSKFVFRTFLGYAFTYLNGSW